MLIEKLKKIKFEYYFNIIKIKNYPLKWYQ